MKKVAQLSKTSVRSALAIFRGSQITTIIAVLLFCGSHFIWGQTTVTYTSSGSWLCPPGVTSIDVQVWGAGGSGSTGCNGGGCSVAGGSGGGGGGYVKKISVPVVAGNSYFISVGKGGATPSVQSANGNVGGSSSVTFGSVTLTATGGGGGVFNGSGGSGGSGSCSGGCTASFSGGSGAGNQSGNGGGGGGGAGSSGNGVSSTITAGGAGGSGSGGSGGKGTTSGGGGSASVAGVTYGGGGGGGRTNNAAAMGADGAVILTYTCVSASDCQTYCTAPSDGTIDLINSFSTSGSGLNISNLNSGFSRSGLGLYTGHIVSRPAGGTVNFSLTAGQTAYSYGMSIWVDWDKNGSFSAAEKVFSNPGSYILTPYSNSFVCPANAVNGDYRMRVAIDYYGTGTNMTPCQFVSGTTGPAPGRFGEAEDYTLRISNTTTLPVELVSFSANCTANGEHVNVNWITASEHNSSHFVVERSADGTSWDNISTAQASGNSTSQIDYSYTDEEARGYQQLYYRLKQYDLNGEKHEYSAVSVVCGSENEEHRVYPNPNNGTFMLELNDADNLSKDYHVEIKNGMGGTIYTEEYAIESGKGQYLIGLPEVAPGIYYLTISSKDATSKTIKVVFR